MNNNNSAVTATATTKSAGWFSRHRPTAEQLAEISALGYRVSAADIVAGINAGTLDAEDELNLPLAKRHLRCRRVIFGVYPARILAECWAAAQYAVAQGGFEGDETALYAARNRNRTVEGGKPTFEHVRWEMVGMF